MCSAEIAYNVYYTNKCYFTKDLSAFSGERMYWQKRAGEKAWFHISGKSQTIRNFAVPDRPRFC